MSSTRRIHFKRVRHTSSPIKQVVGAPPSTSSNGRRLVGFYPPATLGVPYTGTTHFGNLDRTACFEESSPFFPNCCPGSDQKFYRR